MTTKRDEITEYLQELSIAQVKIAELESDLAACRAELKSVRAILAKEDCGCPCCERENEQRILRKKAEAERDALRDIGSNAYRAYNRLGLWKSDTELEDFKYWMQKLRALLKQSEPTKD